ncbi:MAG: GtrA family protein [Muribaculaceae bacterium]|nr:GtrA family protein [Muribaculaceae bacterium]
MVDKIKKIIYRFVHTDSLVVTFIRSSMSSQLCAWFDFIVSFVMFAWVGLQPIYSTAIGALCGGIANCIVNYKFTYHSLDCPWKAVAVKFTMIWFGSMLLNSFGTEGLYWVLSRWHFLERIGFRPDGYFTISRLIVSAVVSLGWNFQMQRLFVYRRVAFDKYAIRFADLFCRKKTGPEANLNYSKGEE